MNNFLKSFLSLSIFILTFSCQEEEISINEPSPSETVSNSLKDLIKRTSMHDGSFDNVIDYANCFSVNLPTTVLINGSTYIVNSVNDYETIENLLITNPSYYVYLQYPVTITLSNHTNLTINSEQELLNQLSDCNGENEVDPDIECIDFEYPISISSYNLTSQVSETLQVNNDYVLYNILNNFDSNIRFNINYPITLIKHDDTLTQINSNNELETEIINAINQCDEDDDYNFNEGNYDCPNLQANYGDDCITSNSRGGYLNSNCECIESSSSPLNCFTITGFHACDELTIDFDGVTDFDLTGFVNNDCNLPEINVTLHSNENDAIANENQISYPFYNTTPYQQIVYFRIELINNPNIYTIHPFELNVTNCFVNICNLENTRNNLMNCHWIITEYDNDLTFSTDEITFLSGSTLLVENPGVSSDVGNYTLLESADNEVILTIQNLSGHLAPFNQIYRLIECNNDGNLMIFENSEGIKLKIEQDCN
jgi:hypothetical protein